MADVFRGKSKPFGGAALFGYAFHGATAILVVWMVLQALGS